MVSNKKRILIIIPYFAPAWGFGGPPRIIYQLARGLAKKHQVTVLTTDAFDKKKRVLVKQEKMDNFSVFRFSNISNYLAWNFKIFLPIKLSQNIESYIKENDFILLSDFRHYLNASALPYLLKYHKSYAIAPFGQMPNYFGFKYFIKKLFDIFFGRRMFNNAKHIIVQTKNEGKEAKKYGAKDEQIRLINLAEEQPKIVDQNNNFRKKYNLSRATKIILWVGRINKLKGLDVLLKAYSIVLKNTTDIKLVIIGRDDGYEKTLQSLISKYRIINNVIQTGPLYGTDNTAAYQAADVFVFTPTFYEETSLAAVRALSFGLPVITVPQAELPYLDSSQAGFTVKCDANSVANKLTELFNNDNLLNDYKQNALLLYNNKYTFDAMIKKYEQLF